MVFLFFSLFLHARDYVSFCAVGDVLLDRGIRRSIEANGVDYPFTDVKKILKQFDITFGNLESPLVSKELGHALNKRYCFRGEPEWVKILKDAGFDILSVANNHTIDWGREGFLETMKNLKEAGIEPVYVFDGEPPEFKKETSEARAKTRKEAERKMIEAEGIKNATIIRSEGEAKALEIIKNTLGTDNPEAVLSYYYIKLMGDKDAVSYTHLTLPTN